MLNFSDEKIKNQANPGIPSFTTLVREGKNRDFLTKISEKKISHYENLYIMRN